MGNAGGQHAGGLGVAAEHALGRLHGGVLPDKVLDLTSERHHAIANRDADFRASERKVCRAFDDAAAVGRRLMLCMAPRA